MRLPYLLAVLVAGCGADPGPPADPSIDAGPPPAPDVVYLSPAQHLVRAAMALRGVRPSAAELAAVRADPTVLPAIVEGYLGTPEFGATMRDLHNEALLTRRFSMPAVPPLEAASGARLATSIGEEPLRLIEHVIMHDRPYTEIVTAGYTVADDVVASAYGLAYDPDGPTWQETHYTDGRPEAGILSSTTLFLRHESAGANWHRGRANALSSALLCHDFLDRDVSIDTSINLADPEVVRDAVVANPACASCHQSLDPLASFFWGYRPNTLINRIEGYPLSIWQPGTVDRWRQTSRRPPGYFGAAADDLGELAGRIAGDPRFSMCAATRFYAFMAQVELEAVPLPLAARLQDVLETSGYSARALARAVVLSDEFRVADGDHVGLKMARPEQLARLFLDLAGFRWETESTIQVRGVPLGRVDLVDNDVIGFTVLAGGIDSQTVVTPSHTPNATSSLFLRAFAAEAAGFVVARDLAEPDRARRRLLTLVEASDRAEPAIRAQLVALHDRLYGEWFAADAPEIDDAYALFASALARSGEPARAWKITLTAMLQDLRIAMF